MGSNLIFQVDSELVKRVYNEKNYVIEFTSSICKEKYCAIYFSSNNIYYPNTDKTFRKKIIENNYYEWRSYKIQKAHKHIYVRDIFKQWYLAGINSEINTPEKFLDFLKNETKGHKIITVGSSAGGYAAILYGSLLSAEKAIVFNAQFEINSLLIYSKEKYNPLVFRLKNRIESKYFDTTMFISYNTKIFYFYSAKSEWDVEQFNHIANLANIHKIGFNTSHHGTPILKINIATILNMSDEELAKLALSSPYSVFLFSVKLVGLKETIRCWFPQMFKREIKHMRNMLIRKFMKL